ncbi:M48 family metallopeptidase [Hirschia litorea]|uniref:M48 family metallopeptidase n=1 Tax=Hirschia litorea TaxID=1199156 RepID=A0ABW2INE9_9PROT
MDTNHADRVNLMTNKGQTIEIRLEINPRARRISLKIDSKKREAVAIAPHRKFKKAALDFAQERIDWIRSRLDELPAQQLLTIGSSTPLRGELHLIQTAQQGRSVYIDDASKPFKIMVPGKADLAPAKVIGFYKAAARADLMRHVNKHAKILNVQPASISIKDTKTRWGSCSSKNNLNFSWRLICAPTFVLDYVAAHECAHLLEMNHSPRFWSHVARCIPDVRPAKNWLNANGRSLHAIGS